ncbi:uncharacterized protein B0H18DRAFT_210550 [Fomitopsis serialis]|uniref:uncharacterized protein n=1 Tax=Fomitopsis serialis TaxID=139415 RepID=UPI002007353A|nr:uncharacterized protein B0H18DRAFT_210550 [Neoantrodia serialis]KAH9929415.1 hypothetical protein B0H18DRAFT_210550 [Neoantrodia serialis]
MLAATCVSVRSLLLSRATMIPPCGVLRLVILVPPRPRSGLSSQDPMNGPAPISLDACQHATSSRVVTRTLASPPESSLFRDDAVRTGSPSEKSSGSRASPKVSAAPLPRTSRASSLTSDLVASSGPAALVTGGGNASANSKRPMAATGASEQLSGGSLTGLYAKSKMPAYPLLSQ